MNPHLQNILDIIARTDMSAEQKTELSKALKLVEHEITITEFKLDRTEKVKRTTAILLEETIEELEQKRKAIEETNLALQKSLEELKAAQDQLVQQEKLASLGQLTAGIAHEIKNPLNFVNNFSDVSLEMIDEVIEEVKRGWSKEVKERRREKEKERIEDGTQAQSAQSSVGNRVGEAERKSEGDEEKEVDRALVLEILDDIKTNLTKIHEHGSRADGIVKSMLMHSRGGTGSLEPTDLNGLVREYVNLSYHGMRAGKHPIDVDIELKLDESVGDVPLIAQDFSRVILNLCNNAFDAMGDSSKPKLTVRTLRDAEKITIEIEDNGPGIPDDIQDKILQPFFTTKKGTQGTGLGLSITHDIIKAHGGSLDVQSELGQTIFKINLNS